MGTQEHLNNLYSTDSIKRNASLKHILEVTESPVDWSEKVWDELIDMLTSADYDERCVAIKAFANIAKNDPFRILEEWVIFLELTKDKDIRIAQLTLQNLWKIGIINEELRTQIIAGLSLRFKECSAEENSTIKRYNIIRCFRKIYNVVKDDRLRKRSLSLISTEETNKLSRKAYLELWVGITDSIENKGVNIDSLISRYEYKLKGYYKKLKVGSNGEKKEDLKHLNEKIHIVKDFILSLKKIKKAIS